MNTLTCAAYLVLLTEYEIEWGLIVFAIEMFLKIVSLT